MNTSYTDIGSALPAGTHHFDKIGILGGTFNPPHCGHLHMALSAIEDFGLDKVILLPVGDPPHKRNINVAPGIHRLNMIEILKGDDSRLEVSDMEIRRQGYTYTIDSLRALAKDIKNAVFYYIIGEDTLFELETWKEYENVFAMTEFICIPRPGGERALLRSRINDMRIKYNKRIALSLHEGPDISSTEIRRLIAERRDTSGLIPNEVRRYIDDNELYRQ